MKKTNNTQTSAFLQRINKYLAHEGIASRREADVLIQEGKVRVNGKPAIIGQQISASDHVEVIGRTKEKIYLAYYKGRGVISHSPETGEVDIAKKLSDDYSIKDVFPVGRLDKSSEGLIIVTNDGRITGSLLDPEQGHEKEYLVTVDKPVKKSDLRKMQSGVRIERYTTKPADAWAHEKNKSMFTIVLTEGKKHQIRRMCAALGYQVRHLKRVRIMNITLGKLKPNQYRLLKGKELQEFLKDLDVQA